MARIFEGIRSVFACSCSGSCVASRPRRPPRPPKATGDAASCPRWRARHRRRHRDRQRRIHARWRHASAPPRSPCPSAGLWASPRPPPIPISALKSGCRRPRLERQIPGRRLGRIGRRDLARRHAGGAEGGLCHHVHRQWPYHRYRRSPMAAANRPGRWAIPKRCWISPSAPCTSPPSPPSRWCDDFYGRTPRAVLFRGLFAGRPSRPDGGDAAFPPIMTASLPGAPAWHWANQMINATWNSRAALQGSQRHDRAKRRDSQQGDHRGLRQAGRRGRRRDFRSAPLPFRSRHAVCASRATPPANA